jgi:hypothetical protein
MEISVKGVLVGIVFGFGATIVGGLIMGFVFGALYGVDSANEMMGVNSGDLTAPTFFLDAIVSVAAGYVAARVAGRGELVNAVLCNLIGAILGLVILMATMPAAMMTGVILLVTEPLFGLLGGYMRRRQVAEYA